MTTGANRPGHGARGGHGVGHARIGRTVVAEHHSPSGATVNGHQPQPSVEARVEGVNARAQVAEDDAPARDSGKHGRPGERSAGRGRAQRRRRERREGAERNAAGSLDRAPQRARALFGLGLPVPAHALLPAPRVLTAREAGGHDRPRRRSDQLLRAAKVLSRGVVRSTEVTPHPRLAENAADAEHEHSRHAASLAPQCGVPNETRSSAPPPAALAACASPPCASAAWRTIASPRPEPGQCRVRCRRGRSARTRAGGRPRRSRGRGRARVSHAVGQLDLDRAALRAPLERVVHEVRDRALDALRLAAHERRLGRDVERRRPSRRARARARCHLLRTISSTRTSSISSPGFAPRASSTMSATSAVSSSSSSRMSARRLARSAVRQPIGVLERLDVGAQAGDRRAQLVAGVGHQVALRLDRALERVERGVEAAREPRELVAAARRRSAARGRASAASSSVRRVKRATGASAVARDDRAQGRAERHAGGAHQQQHEHARGRAGDRPRRAARQLHGAPLGPRRA